MSLSISEKQPLPLSPAARFKAQKSLLYSNLVGNSALYLVTGPLAIILMSDVLGFDALRISFLLAIVPFVSVLRLPAVMLFSRTDYIFLMKLSRLIKLLCVGLLIVMPASFFNFWIMSGIIIVFMFSRECLLMIIWGQVITDYTVNEDRGNFIGKMRFSFHMVNIAFDLAMIPIIGAKMSLVDYRIAAVFVFLLVANGYYWLNKLPKVQVKTPKRRLRFTRSFVRRLFRSDLLRRTLLITGVHTFFESTLLIIYLTKLLAFPAVLVIVITLLDKVGQAFSIYFWGRLHDIVGTRLVALGTLILMLFHPLLLFFIGPYTNFGTETLIIGIFASAYYFTLGIFKAGLGISVTGMQSASMNNSRESMYAYNLQSVILQLLSVVLILAAGSFLEVVPDFKAISVGIGSHLTFHSDIFKQAFILLNTLLTGAGIFMLVRNKHATDSFEVRDFFSGILHSPAGVLMHQNRTKHSNETERMKHARWLSTTKTPLALPQLYALAEDSAFDVKTEAIRSLAFFPGKEPAQHLRTIIDDPERSWVWEHAVWALGTQRDPEAVKRLIDFLSPEFSPMLISLTARALGKIGDRAAVPALRETLRVFPDVLQIQASCCRALMRLKAYEASDEVVEAFTRTHQREERFELMMTLAEWMELPQIWLMRSSAKESTWEILNNHIDWESDRFHTKHAETVKYFREKNAQGITQKLVHYVDNAKKSGVASPEADHVELSGPDTMICALTAKLQIFDHWTPLHVVGTVFLLYQVKKKTVSGPIFKRLIK